MTQMHAYQTFVTRADPEGIELKMLSVVLNPEEVEEGLPALYQVTIMAVEKEKSHHISCSSRRHRCYGETGQCDCTPVPYQEKKRGRLIEFDLPEAKGDGRYPKTLWTCHVRPRNNVKAPWEAAQIIAGSVDEATSLLTANFPGHVWTRLEDTGQAYNG